MAPRHSYSAGRVPDASTSIRICPDFVLAARTCGLEPATVLWFVAHHLAGPDQRWVDKVRWRDFVVAHALWSRPRFNQLVKLGEGLFWTSVFGKRDGRSILYLKGKDKVGEELTDRTNRRLTAAWAEIPLDQLRGVARRRGVAFEALIGIPVEVADIAAKPQARLTLQAKTQVSRRTQQRWNRAAKTRRVKAVVHLGKRPPRISPMSATTSRGALPNKSGAIGRLVR